jgi:biopolymer transport protein ExbD
MRTGNADYGAFVFGEKGNGDAGGYTGYKPLAKEMSDFFLSGKAPFDPQETIEIFAFMDAADESKRLGGAPVSIAETIAKAKAEVAIPVNLLVSPNGTIQRDGQAIALDRLASTLDALTAGKPNSRVKVVLRAEKGTPHETVLSVCNNLGKAMLANFLYER